MAPPRYTRQVHNFHMAFSISATLALVSLTGITRICAFSSPPTSFLPSSLHSSAHLRYETRRSELPSSPLALSMTPSPDNASSGESTGNARSKRRRRKDGKNIASIQQESTTDDSADATPPPPPEEASAEEEDNSKSPEQQQQPPVQMEVMDVRDIMSKGDANTETSAVAAAPSPPADDISDDQNEEEEDDDEYDDDDDEYEDTDEYEYFFIDDDGNEVVVGDNFGTSSSPAVSGSSTELTGQLLADARAMREIQATPATSDDDGSFQPKDLAVQALSYLVTADFFFVVFLLLWFFVGIFSAKVLGDDGIYLYFAGLFEPVVQPALGILILGAGLSAVFGKKDEEGGDE